MQATVIRQSRMDGQTIRIILISRISRDMRSTALRLLLVPIVRSGTLMMDIRRRVPLFLAVRIPPHEVIGNPHMVGQDTALLATHHSSLRTEVSVTSLERTPRGQRAPLTREHS